MSLITTAMGTPITEKFSEECKQANFEAFKVYYVKELNKARSKEELLDMLQWLTPKTENFNP